MNMNLTNTQGAVVIMNRHRVQTKEEMEVRRSVQELWFSVAEHLKP
jgi:hypothetical protein